MIPQAEQVGLAHVQTIPQLIAFVARRYASLNAIEEQGSVVTYAGLETAVGEVAKAYLAIGVEHGDRVAIWAPNSGRWIIAALGAQLIGAVPVPLNTRLKGREAGSILAKSAARVLLTVDDFLGIDYPQLLVGEELPQLEKIVLLSGTKSHTSWETFLASGAAVSDAALRSRIARVSGTDVSDILFTSGTTGQPKGVMTTHSQNLRVFQGYSATLGLRAGDRFLIVNPFFNTFGFKAGCLSALMRGATILPHAVFDAPAVLERIQRDRISVLPGPPTLYQSLLALPQLRDFDRSSLRFAITGSSSIPVELVERMRSELGFQTVLTAYGLTETCGVVSMCTLTDDVRTVASTSGKVIEGVEMRIVDDAGRALPAEQPGEVIVRGYNVMTGYFQDPEETARAIDAEGWLHTGDIGVLDERGYLRITGRKKDMFIVGGFNCYPAEIENILLCHPEIVQAAVIGVPDARLGEVARAHIVVKAGARLTPEEVVSWSRANMANYKVPRSVHIHSSLPMNAAGKVLRAALSEGLELDYPAH